MVELDAIGRPSAGVEALDMALGCSVSQYEDEEKQRLHLLRSDEFAPEDLQPNMDPFACLCMYYALLPQDPTQDFAGFNLAHVWPCRLLQVQEARVRACSSSLLCCGVG